MIAARFFISKKEEPCPRAVPRRAFLRPGFRVSRIAARHQFPCSRDLVIIPFCVITHDNYKYHILLKSNEMDISTP